MKSMQTKKEFGIIFIGIIIGIGVGLYVPFLNKDAHMDHIMSMNSSNPYMMGSVKSEKDFLEQMVLHHEAAVIMANQVLSLSPSDSVKKLAQDIIGAQITEIEMMKSWLK